MTLAATPAVTIIAIAKTIGGLNFIFINILAEIVFNTISKKIQNNTKPLIS